MTDVISGLTPDGEYLFVKVQKLNDTLGALVFVTDSTVPSESVDAFGRNRVSQPISRFDSQFTYDLQPLLFEQITNGAGASIAHNSTERAALMTFSNTPNGGLAYMQSYKHCYYHPGNSQQQFITFNFREHVSDVIKFVGYGDLSDNGIHFISDGVRLAWRILSNTSNGNQVVPQADWSLDTLNPDLGNNPSGVRLDVSKTQIAAIDLQALYTGKVRVGFDIGNRLIYCHEFDHANVASFPYIQTATLPVICGMSCSGTVSTTMLFTCSTVRSEGASLKEEGFDFSAEGTVTAASGARTHILSIRPKTTFNSIINRINFTLENIEVLVTGNNPVLWELVVGQAISGTTTFNDVDSTYSGFEYNTAGTISGSPAIVMTGGYSAATNQSKTPISQKISNRYPIALDAAGAIRVLGTLSLLVTGIGGTSATRATFNFREIR